MVDFPAPLVPTTTTRHDSGEVKRKGPTLDMLTMNWKTTVSRHQGRLFACFSNLHQYWNSS